MVAGSSRYHPGIARLFDDEPHAAAEQPPARVEVRSAGDRREDT